MTDININHITLGISNGCNLKCKYCFCADFGPPIDGFTRFDELLEFLKYLPLEDEVTLIFAGGEVTLFEDNIYLAYESISKFNRSLNNVFHYGIYTNGTNLKVLIDLIDERILDPTRCAISWDGLTGHNIRINSENTIGQLLEFGKTGYGKDVLVRTAINSASVENLYESVKYLLSIGCTKWEYYFLIDDPIYRDIDFQNKFKEQLKLIISEAKTNPDFNFYNLYNFKNTLNRDMSTKAISCSTLGSTLSIDIDGIASPCGFSSSEYKCFPSKMFSADISNPLEFLKVYKDYINYYENTEFCNHKNCTNTQCTECAFTIKFRDDKDPKTQQCALRTIEFNTFKECIINV